MLAQSKITAADVRNVQEYRPKKYVEVQNISHTDPCARVLQQYHAVTD